MIVGIVLGVGALVGAYIGGAQANGSYNPSKWNWSSSSTWKGIVGGAFVGTAAAGIGLVVGAAIAPVIAGLGITGGVLGGTIIGFASGAVSGAFTGAAMSQLPGGSGDFWGGMLSGAVSGAIGGALIGGVVGGITTKGNFWTGKTRPVASGVSDLKTAGAANLDDGLSLNGEKMPDPARLNAIKNAKSVPIDTNAGPKSGPIDTSAGGSLNIKVADVAVQFGKTENQIHHAFRHTDALGLQRELVQNSIHNHFRSVSSNVVSGKPLNQIINIGGQKIQYTAFKLSDNIYNIGRIHGIK